MDLSLVSHDGGPHVRGLDGGEPAPEEQGPREPESGESTAKAAPRSGLKRGALWVAALALGLVAGLFLDAPERYTQASNESAVGASTVNFSLLDQHGVTRRAEEFRGRVLLVFFGYTHCPDICPTTLFEMRQVKAALGPEAHFTGAFITVDPARDTPQRLLAYVEHFDPELLGLSGQPDAIQAAANSFGAVYQREGDVPGGYLMGHTAFGYLVAPDGTISTVFPNEASADEIIAAVRALLAES